MIYIERIQREKANGATVPVGIHPSKVSVLLIRILFFPQQHYIECGFSTMLHLLLWVDHKSDLQAGISCYRMCCLLVSQHCEICSLTTTPFVGGDCEAQDGQGPQKDCREESQGTSGCFGQGQGQVHGRISCQPCYHAANGNSLNEHVDVCTPVPSASVNE